MSVRASCIGRELSCAENVRVPLGFGDGPKWVCGPEMLARPCRVVSLGSAADDRYELGMHKLAGCQAYIVDPSLGAEAAAAFRRKIGVYRGVFNDTVGVGSAASPSALGKVPSFRLVGIRELLHDYYGWRGAGVSHGAGRHHNKGREKHGERHLSAIKIDIEGFEWGTLTELFRMCETDGLRLDLLNGRARDSKARTALRVTASLVTFESHPQSRCTLASRGRASARCTPHSARRSHAISSCSTRSPTCGGASTRLNETAVVAPLDMIVRSNHDCQVRAAAVH